MASLRRPRHTLMALLWASVLCGTWGPSPVRAQGILQAISATEELTYSLISTKTTDPAGTTRTQVSTYGSRTNARINYNLLPTLNVNAGITYDKSFSDLSGDADDTSTELTRLRPYLWLTFRDPVLEAAVGYDLADDTAKTSGQPEISLTRETYNGNVTWRPADLPVTQGRYTRTLTRDGSGALVDTEQDQFFLKSEYLYRGLTAYYAGVYLITNDKIRDLEARQMTHEGKLQYATTLFDGRVSFATDNRMRYTESITDTARSGFAGVDSPFLFSLPAVAGLSSLDNTPGDGPPLGPNPALIDADTVSPAGIQLAGGVDRTRRNLGLDFGTAVAVNRIHVWVVADGSGVLPVDLSAFFSWEVYTSTDNLNWSLQATIASAPLSPFDRRFQIDFPSVSTRYIKVVTQPLVAPLPLSFGGVNVFITEVQAFVDRSAPGGGGQQRLTQTVRSHNVDMKVVLLRAPFLYYRLNADYLEFDPGTDPRYTISNGLFLAHRFNQTFSTTANASYEFGSELGERRTGVLYYASLTATPLRTLTDSLVFSGNRQWIGDARTTSDSLVLYNTAQLYRGIDATLNLGGVVASDEEPGVPALRRREAFVNLGMGITPHPSLTVTTYYLGKLAHLSGGTAEGSGETTIEHRMDLGLSFTPFRSLSVSAAANVASETGQKTLVTQNYGLSWAPFPDGNLQFSFIYAENRLPNDTNSRIIQPSVRWYLLARRRSYLEATYQFNTTEAGSLRTESQAFNTRLYLAY